MGASLDRLCAPSVACTKRSLRYATTCALASRHEQHSRRQSGAGRTRPHGPVGRPRADASSRCWPARRGRGHRDRRASSGCTRPRRSGWSPPWSATAWSSRTRTAASTASASACSGWPAPPPPGSTWSRRRGRSAGSWPPTPARPSTSRCSPRARRSTSTRSPARRRCSRTTGSASTSRCTPPPTARCCSAGSTAQRLDAVLGTLPRLHAAAPITRRRELRDELDEVREHGYAVAVDELEIGLTAVAAPIRNAHGDVIASMSVSGPDVPARRATGSTRSSAARRVGRRRSRAGWAGDSVGHDARVVLDGDGRPAAFSTSATRCVVEHTVLRHAQRAASREE